MKMYYLEVHIWAKRFKLKYRGGHVECMQIRHCSTTLILVDFECVILLIFLRWIPPTNKFCWNLSWVIPYWLDYLSSVNPLIDWLITLFTYILVETLLMIKISVCMLQAIWNLNWIEQEYISISMLNWPTNMKKKVGIWAAWQGIYLSTKNVKTRL